ncbi:MAG TPA: hypothetical protein VFB57_00995 [Gaiellaceae bacterium]|nr:hypothetical protein [Gaiellaceae bacterium]
MSAVPSGSPRLLADVRALDELDTHGREPAFERLEAALGRDFADRLLAALSSDPIDPRR